MGHAHARFFNLNHATDCTAGPFPCYRPTAAVARCACIALACSHAGGWVVCGR
jgi:hypothetical protein